LERVGPFFLSHQMNWSGSGLFFLSHHLILLPSLSSGRTMTYPLASPNVLKIV
jgi:hypothetical protein